VLLGGKPPKLFCHIPKLWLKVALAHCTHSSCNSQAGGWRQVCGVAAVGLLSSVALGLSRELGLRTLQGEGASQLSPFWSLGLHAIAGENHTTLCSMHAGKVHRDSGWRLPDIG